MEKNHLKSGVDPDENKPSINEILKILKDTQKKLEAFLPSNADSENQSNTTSNAYNTHSEKDLIRLIMEQNKMLNQLLHNKSKTVNEILYETEKEKRSIMRETFEPHIQLLFSLIINLQALDNEKISDSSKKFITTLREQLSVQLQQFNHSLLKFYPLSIGDLGLVTTIKAYYNSDRHISNLKVKFHGDLQSHPEFFEIKLYRLIQKFIDLIESCTATTKLDVDFSETEEKIQISFNSDCSISNIVQHKDYFIIDEKLQSLSENALVKADDQQLLLTFPKPI